MKKICAILLLCSSTAFAGVDDISVQQYDSVSGFSLIPRLVVKPSGGVNGMLGFDAASMRPMMATMDSTMGWYTGNVIGLSAAKNAEIAGKFATPSGNTAQYIRGDGSVATFPTIPSVTPFNLGYPVTRSLAVSTSYQATDITKAAVIYPSYTCSNNTTILAASACTIQVRIHNATATCSNGTVYYTQNLSVNLGLLITQNSTNPVPIFLPSGAYFILCPIAGTFTINAVEQTAN